MRYTLEQAIKRENNNFDLIRLLAAIAVLFGHSFAIFLTYGYPEPTGTFLGKLSINDYIGSFAVYLFFFLSGIFITASFINSKTLTRFVLMRLFRIWPALIICILLTVFVIGPLFTTFSITQYFADKQTWRYLFKDILMLNFESQLTSVFSNNHYTLGLNGSLWTLPIEIKCYILTFLFGLSGLLKRKITVIFIFAFFIIFRNNPYLLALLNVALFRPVLFFLAGMLSYKFKEYFIIDVKIFTALVVSCIIAFFINYKIYVGLFYVAFIYAVLLISTSALLKKVKLPSDYSYGVYIYGFLVQQIIAHLFPTIGAYSSMIVTIPITFILGMISWYYIELPALSLGKRLSVKYSRHTEKNEAMLSKAKSVQAD